MPAERVNTPRGFLRISSPEATAYDLVGYPGHCGGLDNVATVLSELGESLDPGRLSSLGELSPIPWSQRLGFLLDLVELSSRSKSLATFVANHATETTVLVPGRSQASANRSARWKLLVNADLELEVGRYRVRDSIRLRQYQPPETTVMAVVQRDYRDKHESSGKSTSDRFGGMDADTKDVVRAINDNLNEHIEETGKRFDTLEAKVDGLVEDVSQIKRDVSEIKKALNGSS